MSALNSRPAVPIATVASAAGIEISAYPPAGHGRLSPSLGCLPPSENDSIMASYDGPIFRKAPDAHEETIYRILGSHPRIVKYLGSDPLTGDIMLSYLRNGALFSHLTTCPNVPLATRLTWAIEIAQGVAYLHARDIIWADPHLSNVLLNDQYHAVLCDFGLSVHNAPYYYNFTLGPPPIYLCPSISLTPRRTDIFGLGVILFVLLSERFPFHKDLFPSPREQIAVMQKHYEIAMRGGVFDELPPSLQSYFGSIVAKCFAISYQSADVLVEELVAAYAFWWKDNEQVRTLSILLVDDDS
ncbi:kinase-like domain-containing protein [Lyophyllum atratum]|nr:kinase-like domain-containing protein [Lyophyllum atratum]